MERIRETQARGGIAGFYPGGIAIAFRQATNWASRQGFTEIVRDRACVPKISRRRRREIDKMGRGWVRHRRWDAGVLESPV